MIRRCCDRTSRPSTRIYESLPPIDDSRHSKRGHYRCAHGRHAPVDIKMASCDQVLSNRSGILGSLGNLWQSAPRPSHVLRGGSRGVGYRSDSAQSLESRPLGAARADLDRSPRNFFGGQWIVRGSGTTAVAGSFALLLFRAPQGEPHRGDGCRRSCSTHLFRDSAGR